MAATTTTRSELVLAAARSNRSATTELEVERLLLALEWAELHPGDEVDESIPWAERELEIAGDGAPTVAEFSIPEFSLAVGLSTDQGIAYVGDAVELAHRLPRTWGRVLAGEVVAWKARKVAQQTRMLSMDGALFVDQALAPVLQRCSFAQIERTVNAARDEFDPYAAEQRRIAAAEERHFDVHLRQVSSTGLVDVTGRMDLADALALEESIAAKAATLDPALS